MRRRLCKYSESATAPRLWMGGECHWSPRSRLPCSRQHGVNEAATARAVVDGWGVFGSPHSRLRRQYGVIHNVTARAVNVTGNQLVMVCVLCDICGISERIDPSSNGVIRVLYGRLLRGVGLFVRGLRWRLPTAKCLALAASASRPVRTTEAYAWQSFR